MSRRLDTWFRGYRSALRHRDVRLLLTSLLISASGSWAYNVALLAFVFERTNSLAWVGAASIVRFVPALVLSPYAGVIAERTERIRLMVGSDWCARRASWGWRSSPPPMDRLSSGSPSPH